MTVSLSQTHCTYVKFSKHNAKKLDGHKVDVQYNCFEVGISDYVYVSMRTVPYFCSVQLEKYYHVEDCYNEDIEENIFSCLVGKLDYIVNEEAKTIAIQVSDKVEGFDYNVRLCLKHFSCKDIGAHKLIKVQNSSRSVTLPYSEILPCLCIEGWLAIPDSRRTRLCPFKNDIDLLWDNIKYNPVTQTMAWQSSCPIHANVSLCWMIGHNDNCADLTNSLHL
ncbi:hypothetical protein GDO86_005874, partial [Hymenochirus boettgeri]